MNVNIAAFWPKFFYPNHNAKSVRFDYPQAGPIAPWAQEFSYDADSDCMLAKQFDAAGAWRNTWYLRCIPCFGVAEVRDDLPKEMMGISFVEVERYSTPIGWGNVETIGKIYSNRPRFEPLACFPPQLDTGFQAISFEELLDTFTTSDGTTYNNVLVYLYQQTWPGGPTSGARVWAAEGIGQIAQEWVSGSIVEPRQDATISYK